MFYIFIYIFFIFVLWVSQIPTFIPSFTPTWLRLHQSPATDILWSSESTVITLVLGCFFRKIFLWPPFGSKHIFLTQVSPCNKASWLPVGWCQLFDSTGLPRCRNSQLRPVWAAAEIRSYHTLLPLQFSPLVVNSTTRKASGKIAIAFPNGHKNKMLHW